MNKLIISAMCLATVGYAFAQEAAPAPEATSQEQCEIEEKDVDTMMDEYISSKGWVEGLNEKGGKRFFVAKGSGVIQAPRASQQYIDSRVNAYNKAMLDAKKAMVEYLGVDIATETAKEYAEGRTKQENLELVKSKLEALPEKIDFIRSIKVSFNVNDKQGMYDAVLESEFDSLSDVAKYRVHPDHKVISEYVALVREARASVDYEY